MFTKNENIVLRNIHGSVFMINIADNYANDRCVLYETNSTGKFIWENIDKSSTIESVARMLYDQLIDDVAFDVVLQDVKEYMEVLVAKKFVYEE